MNPSTPLIDEIFSQECLEILPFEPEAISFWDLENELWVFASYLIPYSDQFFLHRQQELQEKATEFRDHARKIFLVQDGAGDHRHNIPDFWEDEPFGLAAKYVIAFFIMTQGLMEEGNFFSIAHMMEAYSELESSLLLASHMQYKQANQMLFNFLELAVMQLYFCHNDPAFRRWMHTEGEALPLLGEQGILAQLKDIDGIPAALAASASELAQQLDRSIHAVETRYFHKEDDPEARAVFPYSRYQEWAAFLARCVDFAIKAQWHTLDKWLVQSEKLGFHCEICHSTNLSVMPQNSGEEPKTMVVTCRDCGDDCMVSAERLSRQGLI